MSKYEKIITEGTVKKNAVLKILEMLEGESYSDAKEILDTAHYFLKENVYLDYNLAKELIESLGESSGQ